VTETLTEIFRDLGSAPRPFLSASWPDETPFLQIVLRKSDESTDFVFTLSLRAAIEIADRLLVLYRFVDDAGEAIQTLPNKNGEALSRFCYGSPLELVAPLITAMSSISGLAVVIYALKRIWGLDLELRTHRERLRAQFAEAQRIAREAEARLSEGPFEDSVEKAVDELDELAKASGWIAEQAVVFDQEQDEPG
jgi:hypothetical protein